MLERIREGALKMGIALPEDAAEKMLRFHELLMRANEQFNLTRVPDDPKEAADRNFLDSLAPLAQKGLMDGCAALLDLGSGAGFPGIPLAIALYLMLFFGGGIIISAYEGLPVLTCFYEAASAIGTVGLTLGVTPDLHIISRLILIVLMYLGRVGGLTLIYAVFSGKHNNARMPMEKITVG